MMLLRGVAMPRAGDQPWSRPKAPGRISTGLCWKRNAPYEFCAAASPVAMHISGSRITWQIASGARHGRTVP